MSCTGIAAISCPAARSPYCVCACGGHCHGGGGGKPLPPEINALVRALSMLNTYIGIFQYSRQRARRPNLGKRPHKNVRVREILRRARIAWSATRWEVVPRLDGELHPLLPQVVELLNWMEMENPGCNKPYLSPTLLAEIEDILQEMEHHESHADDVI